MPARGFGIFDGRDVTRTSLSSRRVVDIHAYMSIWAGSAGAGTGNRGVVMGVALAPEAGVESNGSEKMLKSERL